MDGWNFGWQHDQHHVSSKRVRFEFWRGGLIMALIAVISFAAIVALDGAGIGVAGSVPMDAVGFAGED